MLPHELRHAEQFQRYGPAYSSSTAICGPCLGCTRADERHRYESIPPRPRVETRQL